MYPWVLSIFAIIPLFLLGLTEYLLQTSLGHSGLFSYYSGEKRLAFRDFVSQFFSLLTLTINGVFFLDLNDNVKLMEPFYQLSKPEGASGWGSLCVDYFSTPLYFTPLKALYHQHWAVFCSSLVALISTNVLPTLALGVFTIDEYSETAMDVTYTRSFEGFLGASFLLTAALAFLIRRRKSGVDGWPSGLEPLIEFTNRRDSNKSLYAFFARSETETKKVDYMSDKELNKIVGPCRFQLQHQGTETRLFNIIVLDDYVPNTSTSWYHKPGTTFRSWWSDEPESEKAQHKRKRRMIKAAWHSLWRNTGGRLKNMGGRLKGFWDRVRTDHLWKDNHPMVFQTVPISVTTVLLLGLFIIANGQIFWATNSRFFTFVGEKRFARSTVSTIINTVVMQQIERDAKMIEPVYLLLRDHGAPCSVLNLNYFGWPFQDLYHSFRDTRRLAKGSKTISSYVLFLILIGTYGALLFAIAWNTLALNSDSRDYGFWLSIGLMIFSEILMLIALATIAVYRRTPVLPRQPITLASRLALVYSTDINKDRAQLSTPVLNADALASSTNIPAPPVSTNLSGETMPTQSNTFNPPWKPGPRNETVLGVPQTTPSGSTLSLSNTRLNPDESTETAKESEISIPSALGMAIEGENPSGDFSDQSTLNSPGVYDLNEIQTFSPLPSDLRVQSLRELEMQVPARNCLASGGSVHTLTQRPPSSEFLISSTPPGPPRNQSLIDI